MRRRWTAAVLAAACVLSTGVPATAAPASFQVAGLDRPATLLIDHWGVPHIYARSAADAFTAQGFNAARDRMFQLDLWLRHGLGRLSEVLGPGFVEQDKATRLFLYRGDIEREWASYGPEAKLAATRFANGVNAYIDYLAQRPEALPVEFKKLGYKPARWTPEDVVRIRVHGLSSNLLHEYTRSLVSCYVGVDADQLRVKLQPAHKTVVPDGFDPCSLPEDVMATYDLAKEGAAFLNGKVQPAGVPFPEGSNNWAISGARTTTGRPILANDPHRALTAPSLRYLAHLNAPGLDVIGAGEPFAPGISLGHNGTSSFGLTVFAIDQEDLYVYELDPADHKRYRYGDGWEEMKTITEPITVAGGGQATAELAYTRHGPVIKVDSANNRAYALRAVWLEPGMSPYYGSMRYLRAKSFTEFRDAISQWGGPSLNHVYADTKGDIGWAAGGKAPKRVGYDGLLPVPGDGRYEWNGFQDGKAMPSSHNPQRGFVATANEYNIPAGHPLERQLGFEWSDPSRSKRIHEVLAGKPKSSLTDTMALQGDQLSVAARRLIELSKNLVPQDPAAAKALALLRDWDFVIGAGSGKAALFEIWLNRHLASAFPNSVAGLPIPVSDLNALLEALEHPGSYWAEDAVAKRDKLLVDTLKGAYDETVQRLGPDPAAWKWNSLTKTVFGHPATGLLDPETAKKLTVGPLSRGGSWQTVDINVYNTFQGELFRQWAGATVRLAIDVGNWDASRAVNAPGQSGDPDDPHYRDLTAKWHGNQYFPLLYSKPAVLANVEKTIVLLPRQ